MKRADYYDRILGDTLTFWMWAEELAQLGDAGKSGFSNLRTVMRIAYDLGSKFGQDFASDNSYSGTADVCICSMFCATPQDVDEIYTRKEVMGGGPIVISSGYRCNQLNVKVGGAYASQHTLGEAADISLPLTSYTAWDDNRRHTDLETARKWFDWIEHHTDFDQLILETSNGKDFWIHVSCRKNRKANRHQVLRYLKK